MITSVIYKLLIISIGFIHTFRLNLKYNYINVRNNRIFSENVPEDYKEIIKNIEKRQTEDLKKYLDPMKAASIKGISEDELERTFGKLSSPENLKRKEDEQYSNYHPYEPPLVPPTNKIPYCLNLEFPNRILGPVNLEESVCGKSIREGYEEQIQQYKNKQSIHTKPQGDISTESLKTLQSFIPTSLNHPPEVQSNSLRPADSSSNYLPVNGNATPGDRGEDEGGGVDESRDKDVTSGGMPAADLREAEGEINRRGSTPSGTTSSGEAVCKTTSGSTSTEKEVDKTSFGENNTSVMDSTSSDIPNVNRVVYNEPLYHSVGTEGMDMSYSDPLRELIDANEDYGDLNETYGPAWYKKEVLNELTPIELEDGWSILPCGTIYKHILRPSELFEEDRTIPNDESCCTFAFKVLDAINGTLLIKNEDLEGPLVATYMNELGPAFQRCLKSMECGEQSEFIFHISEYNPDNMFIEELEGVKWIRLWLYLWEHHLPNERWWGVSALDNKKYPEETPSNLTKQQQLDAETDELKEQIQAELSVNPTSPLWNDVLSKMSSEQKQSYVEHFEKNLEKQEKMKYCEYSGSRGYGDNIKQMGQLNGYDIGRMNGGVSKYLTWKETPFIIYIAMQVVPGIRSEHVSVDISYNHICIRILDKIVLDDDLTGHIDINSSTWVMSEESMNYKSIDNNKFITPIIQLFKNDTYDSISKKPCIILALRKSSTNTELWGAPFINS